MSRIWITVATAALLAAAACSSEPSPTAATDPVVPDIGLSAFPLTIDVPSGRITVAPPARPSESATAVSLSLIGSEAVALHASTCTWSTTPGNSKQKRCRFDLAIENRLGGIDLRTPTTFPQPPAGTTGILVFPFTAASLGTPSNGATPTTDWNNAPANFFNDFGGCSRGNDCYRSETYAAPLFSGETSEAQTVGFDVDKNAQTVVAYIVVAADLRDATPAQTVTVPANAALCGTVSKQTDGSLVVVPLALLRVGTESGGIGFRAACSFTLPPNVHITKATLRLYQDLVTDDPFAGGNSLIVDHLDYGVQFVASLYDQAALAANIGALSTGPTAEEKTLDVTSSVKDDVVHNRAASQFRFRFVQEPAGGHVRFSPPADADGPQLVVTYRVP
jgi:hypothetical protein